MKERLTPLTPVEMEERVLIIKEDERARNVIKKSHDWLIDSNCPEPPEDYLHN